MSNSTVGNGTVEEEDILSITEILLLIADVTLIIIITVGNSLTVAAVCRFKRLQNSNNVMIASLAIADLIMGTVYTPAKIIYTTWPKLFVSRVPCVIYIFISHFASFCAVLGLSLLSLERGYAVHFPFDYHSRITIKLTTTVNVCAFLGIICLNLPMLVGLDNYNGKDCFAPQLFPTSYLRTLIAVGAIILLLGFLSFIRVLTAELRRQKNSVAVSGRQSQRSKQSLGCRLMCVVYTSSLVFWLPHMCHYFYITFTNEDRKMLVFRLLSISDLCSSAVNFVIYGFKISSFRMAYRQLLGMKKRTTTESSSVMTTNTVIQLREEAEDDHSRPC